VNGIGEIDLRSTAHHWDSFEVRLAIAGSAECPSSGRPFRSTSTFDRSQVQPTNGSLVVFTTWKTRL